MLWGYHYFRKHPTGGFPKHQRSYPYAARLLRGRLIFHAPHMDCSLARSYPIFALDKAFTKWQSHDRCVYISYVTSNITNVSNIRSIQYIKYNKYIQILQEYIEKYTNLDYIQIHQIAMIPMILLDFPPERQLKNLRHQRTTLGSKVWLGDSLGTWKSRLPKWPLFFVGKNAVFLGGWKRFPSKIEVIEVIRASRNTKNIMYTFSKT